MRQAFMDPQHGDVVSASEIASWEWCPEAWRLETLGEEPENREERARGEAFHARTAATEVVTRRARVLGLCLLVLALLVFLLWALFVGELSR
jgi:hypothetical protein